MKLEVSLSEMKEVFNIINEHAGKIFELLRFSINQRVGDYLSELMKAELTEHLGREPYEHVEGGEHHPWYNGRTYRT